jgi:hypothetical protein
LSDGRRSLLRYRGPEEGFSRLRNRETRNAAL